MSRSGGDIAVIGLACSFPGAPDLRRFWESCIHPAHPAPPEAAAGGDAEQVAGAALADAGYGDPSRLENLRTRTEVIIGSSAQALLPEAFTGRIAGRLGLAGPSYTVDAGGASSLAAVDLAVNDLRSRRCDMALAGGVHATPATGVTAQSSTPSHGVGVLVLKRLEDAESAGDRIYALIKKTGAAGDEIESHARERGSSHGRNPAGQDAAAEVFESYSTPGMAAIIKTIMALHHKILPPIQPETGNMYRGAWARPWIYPAKNTPRNAPVRACGSDNIRMCVLLEEYAGAYPAAWCLPDWDAEMFVISGETRGEMLREAERLLGFICEFSGEFPLKDLAWTCNRAAAKASRLVIVAASREDLRDKLRRAIDRLRDERAGRLRAIDGIYYFSRPLDGKIAFVFPGEGSQYSRMLADLCVHFPEVREFFDLMDRAFEGHPGGLPSEAIFPRDGEDDARLYSIDGGAAAVFAANQALCALLGKLGLRADVMAGHSIGEHCALLASGVVRAGDEEEMVGHVRGVSSVFEGLKNSIGIPEGTLLTIAGADHALLEKLVAASGGDLHIALDNCPHQVVVCGPEPAVDAMIGALAGKAAICQKLPFARAYHTPWFDVFTGPLRRYFDSVAIGGSDVAVYSCITAGRYASDPDEIRGVISRGWASTVRFRETVQAMYRDGVRIFVEVGPRGNLAGFIDDTLRGKPYIAIPANTQQRSGIAQLQHMLAQLVAHGVPVRLRHLYERRNAAVVPYAAADTARPSDARHPAKAGRVMEPSRTPAVMRGHLQTMARFLEVQQQVMTAYFAAAGRWPSPKAAPGPFIGEVLDLRPGERARARCRLSPERGRIFLDHTQGRDISQDDPGLSGLPVAPLAVLIEILAEGAALLEPGRVLVGVRDFRACRDVAVEQPDVAMELEMKRRGPGAVHVTMRESGSSGALRPVWAEGLMRFAARYPAAPRPKPLALENERCSRWTADRLYVDGLAHGPAFQAVKTVDRIGENGAAATVEILPREGLLAGVSRPAFLIDPVLLDAAGQTVALWSQEQLDPTGDVVTDRLSALDCHGPLPQPGTRAACRAAVTRIGDKDLSSDIEIVDPAGRLLYRMSGWEARRFPQTPEFWQFRAAPRDSYLSDVWNEPISAFRHHGPMVCCRLDGITREFCDTADGIWRKVLAHLVLSRRERKTWMSMRAVDKRKHEWLLGRCAVKDAVRMLVKRHKGVQLAPADVEIVPDAYGRPRLEGAWMKALRIEPAISIAHSHGVAAALAALDPGQLVGIDLESLTQRREGFESIAFGPEERGLLASLRQEIRQEWALRMWCAKEAVGKALGRGLSAGLNAFHITGAEIDTGAVRLELRDGMLEEFPQLRGKPMVAYTAREMDFVFSTIIYQRGAVQ